MVKVLLVYLPFCTPASPPYSITNLYSCLKQNNVDVSVLDLNLEFHKQMFPRYYEFFRSNEWSEYSKVSEDFRQLSAYVYAKNNRKVVDNQKPEFFDEFLSQINDSGADVVAFSIVYSSQAFYAYALMKELKMKCVIGGPAVSHKLVKKADAFLKDEKELLEYVGVNVPDNNYYLDYSIWDLGEYFSPYPVIPLKTSNTCYYKGCTFCSHFSSEKYKEYDLEFIKKTINESKSKYFYFIDDMIPVNRLLEIASITKELNVEWTCQLKPVKELTLEILRELYDSGLKYVIWGVESGCDRVLKLMNKGTNVEDIRKVLDDSHKAGIKNVIYIMIGFPTETKDEFVETVKFLKDNYENIDLVSSAVFGLQKGTKVYDNLKDYGIEFVDEVERTVLDPKVNYIVSKGMNQKEAKDIRHKYKRKLEKLNKYPKMMNLFREHMFF